MRPIKFRAWDKVNKHMIYKQVSTGCSEWPYISLDGELFGSYTSEGGGGVEELDKSDFELMQFTGLHDKNGKEIWEGDILQSDGYFQNHIVEWDEDRPGFRLKAVETRRSHLWNKDLRRCVIGNIHENPELLVRP